MRRSNCDANRIAPQRFKFQTNRLRACATRHQREFQSAVPESVNEFLLREVVQQDPYARKSFLKGQAGNQISSAISAMEIRANFTPEHRALNLMRHAKSSSLRNHDREVVQRWCFIERFQSSGESLLAAQADFPAEFLCKTDSNLTAAFRPSRRRTSSSSIRANASAFGLGRKAGRPIITSAVGNMGVNGLATKVRGMIVMMPSVRIAAARCASNSVNNVERPSFTIETKRGKMRNGLSIPRRCGTYSG